MNTAPLSGPDVDTTRLPGHAIVVGFSGGLDSSVLLHLLAAGGSAGGRELRALHVHHGLHADADAWAAHCQDRCDRLGVPLTVVRAAVAGHGGLGPEAAAREARHAAFAAALQADEVLALAQHRDDQSETFMLRALRASGPDGLAAMRPWRRFGDAWLWRPLLELPRARLLAYAQHHGLQWMEDPSNQDTALDRNFLRHRVLPLLRERWPHVDAAFARSAALCAESADLLREEDAASLSVLQHDAANTLDVPALQALPAARRARVLRRWIDQLGLPPLPAAGLARIESDLLPADADARAQFAWRDAVIHRWRDRLHAGSDRPALPPDWEAPWDGSQPLALPGGGRLQLHGTPGFGSALRVHARHGGEQLVLPGRQHSHTLKHVLQERGVPPWQRACMPLLSDGETLLAAGDTVYSASFDAWLREHDARLAWSQPL